MAGWDLLPEPLLFSVFCWLKREQVLTAGRVCSRWLTVSRDDLLWRRLLCQDYKLKYRNTKLRQGATGWLQEYKRLMIETPLILKEEIKHHTNEVLHVSFSHSGDQFVTCSKDGFLLVWNIDKTASTSLRFTKDMTTQGWLFTWASKYNQADTLLLVAGVLDEVNGEIAVFDTKDYSILCRVTNNPYDVMGAWCDDSTWISGRMSDEPEDQCATVHLCRTYPMERGATNSPSTEVQNNIALKVRSQLFDGTNYLRCLLLSNRNILPTTQGTQSIFGPYETFLQSSNLRVLEPQDPDLTSQKLLADNEFCLIFLCSNATCIPHQLGFKRLYPQDLGQVPVITAPDRLIELSGHIVGISLAGDGRHLYVNVRRWPDGAVPREDRPPSIAQEIEMVVVDLLTLTLLDTVYTGHRGYTDSQGAFYIYLDISNLLVGSGSEDGKARIWDRHYGCQVASLQHKACVNSVAFSPRTEGILVTVSDDFTIKVWKSKNFH